RAERLRRSRTDGDSPSLRGRVAAALESRGARGREREAQIRHPPPERRRRPSRARRTREPGPREGWRDRLSLPPEQVRASRPRSEARRDRQRRTRAVTRRPPIYFATVAAFAALVGLSFFGDARANGAVLLETPRLVVLAILLAVGTAKFVRAGMRREEDARTRRDDLEAGGLLVTLGAIAVEATGGPSSPAIPATFLLVA